VGDLSLTIGIRQAASKQRDDIWFASELFDATGLVNAAVFLTGFLARPKFRRRSEHATKTPMK
jgi:hypothetical protein